MTDTSEQRPDDVEQLDLAVETIEDLDGEDADQQVWAAGPPARVVADRRGRTVHCYVSEFRAV